VARLLLCNKKYVKKKQKQKNNKHWAHFTTHIIEFA